MSDMIVGQIDDTLSRRLEVGGVLVDHRDPSQGLRGRRYIVAVGGEDDHRSFDLAQIGHAMIADRHLAAFQPVADEQVLGD